ncbi:hypothetical protein CBL_08613 [Carabus blaptoides fortunei]
MAKEAISLTSHCESGFVILSTALVQVRDTKNNIHSVRALLDNGPQSNYITLDLCKRLKLNPEKIDQFFGQWHQQYCHQNGSSMQDRTTRDAQCIQNNSKLHPMEIYKATSMLSPLSETPPARRTAGVVEEVNDILKLSLPTNPEPPTPAIPRASPRTKRCRIRLSPFPTTPEAPRTLPLGSQRTPRSQTQTPSGIHSPVTPEVPITPELHNFLAPALPEAVAVPAEPKLCGYPEGIQPLSGKNKQVPYPLAAMRPRMVHTYVRKTKRQSWSAKCMQQAIETIVAGNMRYRQTVVHYGMPKTPLDRKVTKFKKQQLRRRRLLW